MGLTATMSVDPASFSGDSQETPHDDVVALISRAPRHIGSGSGRVME